MYQLLDLYKVTKLTILTGDGGRNEMVLLSFGF